MTATIDQKRRLVVKAFQPGDVVQVEQQGSDIVVLHRMKPAEQPKPRVIRQGGELFSEGGRKITSADVRRMIEDE